MCLRTTVFLGLTEADHAGLVLARAGTNQEAFWLDITVNEGFGLDVFDAGDELVGQEQHCLEGELAIVEVKQILQVEPQQVEHHGIVYTLCSEPANKGDGHAASQRLVDLCFVFEMWILGFDVLELDGNLFACGCDGTLVNAVQNVSRNFLHRCGTRSPRKDTTQNFQ